MKALIINIGDELLIGQTVNTNASWLGATFNAEGIRVVESKSIADDEDAIRASLDDAFTKASLVIITGGLGPTKDDITKKTLTSYFNTELVMHEPSLQRVKSYFEKRGVPFLPVNEAQALVPKSCEVLENMVGTANGMWFSHEGKACVSLPGVPYEMKYLIEYEVLPRVRKAFSLPTILHRTYLTQGIGESFLAELLTTWEDSLADEQIKLAYLPSPGLVKLRMSAYATGSKEEMQERLDRKEKELRELISDYLYGVNEESLAGNLVAKLFERKENLAIAESCTGGMVAERITEVSGASDVFKLGLVTYQVESKVALLGLSKEFIGEHGVVSAEVVSAMAKAVREKAGTSYGIATTGWAGPTGGDERHEVGTIFIGVSSVLGEKWKKLKFGTNRQRNREMATWAILMLLLKEIGG